MKKSTRAAIRTARSLMARGLLGRDLQSALVEAHPLLSPNQRKLVSNHLRKEVGILGQVAHDPNLFNNCKQATAAKEKHPHPHTLIATYRTPLCTTCAYNRKGGCGLMGGQLIASADAVDEKIVDRTASILVEDGLLPSSEAQRIASSPLPAGKRAAALHLRLALPIVDDKANAKAQQESRRMAGIMQNDTTIQVASGAMKGPRKASNREDREMDGSLEAHPGDDRIARRAFAFDVALRPADMTIEIPGEPTPPRKDVRLASRSVFDVPKMDSGNHRKASAVKEEHLGHIQDEHDRVVRTAASLLARGDVDTEKASTLTQQLDVLRQHGAVATRRAERITRQLSALTGALEL